MQYLRPQVASWLVAGMLVACNGDGKDPDDTGTTTPTTPTTETGTPTTPTTPTPGDPVIVVSGPAFMPTRTSDMLTVNIYNTDVTDVTYTSSDPTVLEVDDQGAVSALTPGVAIVTAEITVDGTVLSDTAGIVVDNEIPYYDEWRSSGHADYDAEAFTHWDEDGSIQESCAACHSTFGYQDYLGADGTPFESVESPAALGSAVECAACHNAVGDELDTVLFPSGERISDLGPEARCMTCHQGRSSGDDLDEAFATEGLTDTPDVIDTDLGFTNIHYYPAGATLYAGQVRGGYQYAGQVYDWRFRHVEDVDTCTGCHDQHSLELRIDRCQDCHPSVAKADDAKDIRSLASASDYDGDGDTSEGIYFEMEGLRTELLDSLQIYVTDVGADAICYDAGAYPYFFVDNDGDGSCSMAEANFGNRYASWTARALSAAYNYQLATQDPGNYAHNAKYTIQLLHDSLQDLNLGLTTPKDLSALERNDPGHFNGAGEAARHWDEDVQVSASCSQCHGGVAGLEFYLEYGVGLQGGDPDNGLECETCHADVENDLTDIREVADVTFPSGITIAAVDNTSNLCITCHSGRNAKATVDARIDSGNLGFVNIHYRAAGATRYGADAAGGYEYDGNTYSGAWTDHVAGVECTDCHDPAGSNHTFQVSDAFANCQLCHGAATEPDDIRATFRDGVDYDGDGDATEPLADELDGLADLLIAQMQVLEPICYADSYPYFFTDTNDNGVCDNGEANFGNQFGNWSPALMRAAYNYQFEHTDPGAWSHNFDYMAQLLIDSIEDIGGDVSGLTRPAP